MTLHPSRGCVRFAYSHCRNRKTAVRDLWLDGVGCGCARFAYSHCRNRKTAVRDLWLDGESRGCVRFAYSHCRNRETAVRDLRLDGVGCGCVAAFQDCLRCSHQERFQKASRLGAPFCAQKTKGADGSSAPKLLPAYTGTSCFMTIRHGRTKFGYMEIKKAPLSVE